MPEQATTKQARYAGNHEAHCPYLRILSHHGFGHHVIDLYGIYLCKNIFFRSSGNQVHSKPKHPTMAWSLLTCLAAHLRIVNLSLPSGMKYA